MSAEARRWRAVLLALCVISAIGLTLYTFECTPLLRWCADLGFSAKRTSTLNLSRVASLQPGSAAATAGLRNGDLIDLRELGFTERVRMHDMQAFPQESLRLIVHRDGTTETVVLAAPADPIWPSWLGFFGWFNFSSGIVALIFVAIIAIRRPELVSARLLALTLIAFAYSQPIITPWPAFDLFTIWLLPSLFPGAMALFAAFASSLARSSPIRTALAAFTFLAAAVAIVSHYATELGNLAILPLSANLTHLLDNLDAWATPGAALGSIACGIAAAIAAVGRERQLALWTTLSVGIGFVVGTIGSMIGARFGYYSAVAIADTIAFLALPFGFTYALIGRRLLDIGFVINRATAVGIVLSIVVGCLALLEWFLSSVFAGADRNVSVAIGVAATLVLGVAMPSLYRRIADGVERIFFRRDYLARQRVATLASGLPFADSADVIARTITHDICAALGLPSGAVFRRAGNDAFHRVASVGWLEDDKLDALDGQRLAMSFTGSRATMLAIEEHPGDCFPDGDRRPVLAFPLFGRQALIGFVLYSNHVGNGDLDPDERALLAEVAQQASRGYDAVELAAQVEHSYRARVEAEAEAKETLRRSYTALERVNEAQARFVPAEFLRLLERESLTDVQLGDNVLARMTIFFSDIRSFTTISEAMEPPQIFAFLNEYLHHVGPLVREHGGFIDKYIGDAVMGLFPSSADDALKAGIALQKELRIFNRRSDGAVRPAIAAGVGIHTGPLMLGTIGERGRMETTVIADAVNTAWRLESATKELRCSIVLSTQTVETLTDADRFLLRRLGKLHVKGKTEPLEVFEAYDADLPDLATHKHATAEEFAGGLTLFEAGDFAGAERVFSALVSRNAADGPAAHYLERCRTVERRPSTGSG